MDTETCPNCGAHWYDYRHRFPDRHSPDQFIFTIKDYVLVKNDATFYMLKQVEYHVSDALVLLEEIVSNAALSTDSVREDARVKVEKNVLKIIGHLSFAADCASGFPDLYKFLYRSLQIFQNEGLFFDIKTFLVLFESEVKNLKKF